jgi:CPA1 family monovalent cation:H+ antiporter
MRRAHAWKTESVDEPLAIVGLLVGLVLTVLGVSNLARALSWPAPLALVAAGVIGSLLPWVEDLRPSPDVVLVGLIPPLLYAAALQTSAIDIRAEMAPIASLSVGLVLATTLAVGFALHAAVPEVPLAAAMALGAIVAPPDAVATAAVTRRAGLPRRAVTVLEGESLFDDATALVALRVSVAAVVGSVTASEAAAQFVGAAVGASVVGLAVGYAISFVRRRVTDSVTDTALSLTAPYLAFLPAERLHASGVLAVVVTGLVLAHRSPLDQEPTARLVEGATWATIARLLEGTVFVLIGFQLRDIVSSLDATSGELVVSVIVVLAVVLALRPLWIFATSWIGGLLPGDGAGGAPWRLLAAVSWAGMRGVVSLAAALALPLDMPQRDLILVLAVVIILGTLGVQGLTLPWVIRRLGIEAPDPHDEALQRAHALDQAAQAGLDRLHEVTADAPVPEEILDALRRVAQERALTNWVGPDDDADESPTLAYRRVRREMMAAERATLLRLRDDGEIDDDILRALQRELDLEDALLAEFEQSDTSGKTDRT